MVEGIEDIVIVGNGNCARKAQAALKKAREAAKKAMKEGIQRDSAIVAFIGAARFLGKGNWGIDAMEEVLRGAVFILGVADEVPTRVGALGRPVVTTEKAFAGAGSLYLFTPHDTHLPFLEAAIDSGSSYVTMEKPLFGRGEREEAADVVDLLLHKKWPRVRVNDHYEMKPGLQRISKALSEDDSGIERITIMLNETKDFEGRYWLADWYQSGGMARDMIFHGNSVILYLVPQLLQGVNGVKDRLPFELLNVKFMAATGKGQYLEDPDYKPKKFAESYAWAKYRVFHPAGYSFIYEVAAGKYLNNNAKIVEVNTKAFVYYLNTNTGVAYVRDRGSGEYVFRKRWKEDYSHIAGLVLALQQSAFGMEMDERNLVKKFHNSAMVDELVQEANDPVNSTYLAGEFAGRVRRYGLMPLKH